MIISVRGLKRSGNHAIINWLLGNLGDDYDFYNNVFDIPNIKDDNYIFSFEDYDLIFRKKECETKCDKNIIILRDYYNLLASRIMTQRGGGGPLRSRRIHNGNFSKFKKMWLDYADETKKDKFIFINYNKWFKSKEYRDKIMIEHFDIENKDKNLNDVDSFYGNGSSFDGVKFNNRAQEMKVLDRWDNNEVKGNELFYRSLEDKRISKLNLELFGFYLTKNFNKING